MHFSRSPYTFALEDRDYPEWRRGRERYAIWMVDADTAPLRERVGRVRGELAGLFAPHQRSPHITLHVCGFISEPAILDDDFDGAMLARQRAALAAARRRPARSTSAVSTTSIRRPSSKCATPLAMREPRKRLESKASAFDSRQRQCGFNAGR